MNWGKTLDAFENHLAHQICAYWLDDLIFAFWSFLRPFFKLERSNLIQLEHLKLINSGLCDNRKIPFSSYVYWGISCEIALYECHLTSWWSINIGSGDGKGGSKKRFLGKVFAPRVNLGSFVGEMSWDLFWDIFRVPAGPKFGGSAGLTLKKIKIIVDF